MAAEVTFIALLSIIIYSYFGYTILLAFLSLLKKENPLFANKEYLPDVTIFIAAYNERILIPEKMENLRALDYPKEKLQFVWVTDGSDDGSEKILSGYNDVKVYHENARNGKIGAINRGMQYVTSPVTIFCDANNFLSSNSVKEITALFYNENVGCVAGEKRIFKSKTDAAAGSGEGTYWQYESLTKRLESQVNSTIGAAGELFAIRTKLFEPVEPDAILDDFIISMRIAQKGYKIKYAPKAIATEQSSERIENELKRKVRIAAGGWQTMPRIASLLNPFKFGFLSIQYWSHKVLRWTIIPISMFLLFPINIYLSLFYNSLIYNTLLLLQLAFYLLVCIGYILRNHQISFRMLFIPYYLVVMNISIILGFIRFLKGKQSVNWEKARR